MNGTETIDRTRAGGRHDRMRGGGPENGRGRDIGLALLCAAVVAACWVAAYPVADQAFNDDFSYTFTARHLAQTGQFTYNGWAAMVIGPMAYWGALFIKLFGFSFTILRVSMLPIAAGSVAVTYALARKCGLRPGLAMLSALTLGVSPLFLPLAASFMTDVPGLFFMVCALYAVISAGQASSPRAAIGWIVCLLVLALVGGTVRQIVWITALAGLPPIAWAWRSHVAVIAVAILGWIVVVVGAVVTMHWFARQPFAIPDEPISFAISQTRRHPMALVRNFVGLLCTLTLAIMPVIVALMALAWRRVTRLQWAMVGAALVLIMVVRHLIPTLPGAPWIGNTVTLYGVMDWGGWDHGRPRVLPAKAWLALSLLTYAAMVLGTLAAGKALIRAAQDRPKWPAPIGWSVVTLVLYALGYLALVLPRCAYNQAYDRYLLPLFPAITIPLLLLYQRSESVQSGDRKFLRAGWVVLVGFALFAISITQEVHSLARGRAAIGDELVGSGVPRPQIDGGFEFNFWTQLLEQGYINDPRIVNPPNAYQRGRGLLPVWEPRYRIVFANAPLMSDEAVTTYPTVTYHRYLPPFSGVLGVRRIIGPAKTGADNERQQQSSNTISPTEFTLAGVSERRY